MHIVKTASKFEQPKIVANYDWKEGEDEHKLLFIDNH